MTTAPTDEYDLEHIRYRHRVTAASWSTEDRRWTVEVTRGDTGQQLRFTTGFLWMCQGYYNHAKPYRPRWAGMDRFQGVVVHPQRWPGDLDPGGKRVVVIGSGATAATLIPAIAEKAKHVTMLQRSPSYFKVSSGEEIPADIVVTATGFNLSVLGDVAFTVDGKPVDFTERVTWRGIMINGLPNMAYVFGYFRHSWTLRVDLVSDLVGRLLANMRDKDATMVVPALRPQDTDMQLLPWSDPENFNPGYVTRSQRILIRHSDPRPPRGPPHRRSHPIFPLHGDRPPGPRARGGVQARGIS